MLYMILISLAGMSVGTGDILIKMAAEDAHGSILALIHPFFAAAVGLYLIQITIITYIFTRQLNLSTVGIIQIALYAVFTVASGNIFFHERITAGHAIGISLALAGAFIVNR